MYREQAVVYTWSLVVPVFARAQYHALSTFSSFLLVFIFVLMLPFSLERKGWNSEVSEL